MFYFDLPDVKVDGEAPTVVLVYHVVAAVRKSCAYQN